MIYNLIYYQQTMKMKKMEEEEVEADVETLSQRKANLRAKYKLVKDIGNENVQDPIPSLKKAQSEITDNHLKKLEYSHKMQGNQQSQMIMNSILNKKIKSNQFLSFPPPLKAIQVKRNKGKGNKDHSETEFLMQIQTQVINLLEQMEKIYAKDLEAFQNEQMAIHKITFLKKFTKRILNMPFRARFIEQGGLDVLGQWLRPLPHQKYGLIQPSCTLKTGLLTIIRDMSLSSDQIDKTSQLFSLIEKNKYSASKDIRNLACSICQQYTFRMIEAELHGRSNS